MVTRSSANAGTRYKWELEVIRGREIGRRYAVDAGEMLVGNELQGARGLELADQEANSPRRMAGRQATLTATGETLSIRDLESPGGTFVNRQRLLSGMTRVLQPGDLIQVGSVQLEVKRELQSLADRESATKPQPQAKPQPVSKVNSTATAVERSHRPASDIRGGALSIPYTSADGAICRTWDDFLTLAAQRWPLVRDELTSGRIAEHLRRIQRVDLLPSANASQNADEQLDHWLERLPSGRSSAPELDVHPDPLVVRVATAGGTVRQSLKISNVGYRLLRSKARVEETTTTRLRLSAEFTGRPFLTVDQTDLPVEIDLPEDPSVNALGAIVIESNGGTRRIPVRLERPVGALAIPARDATVVGPDLLDWSRPLRDRVIKLSLGRRVAYLSLMIVVFRLLIVLAGLIPLGSPAANRVEPRLGALTFALAALGLVAGVVWGARGADRRDMLSAGFAGGLLGFLAAAVGYALIKSGESLLGSWSSSLPVVLLFWWLVGAALAFLSWIKLPSLPEPNEKEPVA
jgi:hypothetical protein